MDSELRIGIVGSGRMAGRFIEASRLVDNAIVTAIFNPHVDSARKLAGQAGVRQAFGRFDFFAEEIDAVYIAVPAVFHEEYIEKALLHGKHVLCEKPLGFDSGKLSCLFKLAKDNGLVLMEAIKTAYCPGFVALLAMLKAGIVGKIVDVEAAFTKLLQGHEKELNPALCGGSLTELGSYVVLPLVKLFGSEVAKKTVFYTYMANSVDLFTSGTILYSQGLGTFKAGFGVKTEGALIVSGTTGYVYVRSPWWKTASFAVRREDPASVENYEYEYFGSGIQYELKVFSERVAGCGSDHLLTAEESLQIIKIMEEYRKNKDIVHIIQ
jgi:choline-phosphate cytidylyltransferase